MGFRLPAKQASRIKRPRAESKSHLEFVGRLPCLICGDDTRTEAAHIRMASAKFAKSESGIGQKPDDAFTVPLCSDCHARQHDVGEEIFWSSMTAPKDDPLDIALRIWKYSGDYESATLVIKNAR
jgi:hypothetical protein